MKREVGKTRKEKRRKGWFTEKEFLAFASSSFFLFLFRSLSWEVRLKQRRGLAAATAATAL